MTSSTQRKELFSLTRCIPMEFVIYFFTLLFAFSFNFNLWSVSLLTQNEKKVFRREMIEFDIQVRNLASAISLGDQNLILFTLVQLSSSRVALMPEYKKIVSSIYKKLKNKSYYVYLKAIRLNVVRLHEKINRDLRRHKKFPWKDLYKEYQIILNNCRLCHSKMIK